MKYTIEITIAGCSTNCAHCYVDGGYAKAMTFENYKICIKKIKPLLNILGTTAAVTLGNELFCNPYIDKILEYNITQLGDYFSYSSYYVPTTGIALLARKDKEKILELLKKCGAKGFMLALHGNVYNHNSIVENPIGYKTIFNTANFVMQEGFDVLYNIIVSKNLLCDFDFTLQAIKNEGGQSRLTVPVFVPTERMRKYQNFRADVSDCIKIAEASYKFGIDTNNLLNNCKTHTEKALFEAIKKGCFSINNAESSQDWVFLNITKDLDLFYGNVGSHTRFLGNIKNMSCKEIVDVVIKLLPNYDYTAYYNKEYFDNLYNYVKSMVPDEKVYASYSDCIYNILDKNNIKSLII